MRLLDKLDAAVGAIFLHSQDQYTGLLLCVFDFVAGDDRLLLLSILKLGGIGGVLVAQTLRLEFDCGNSFHYGDIEGCLSELVQHEQMVR